MMEAHITADTGFKFHGNKIREADILKSEHFSTAKRRYLVYHMVVWDNARGWMAYNMGIRLKEEVVNNGNLPLKVYLEHHCLGFAKKSQPSWELL